MDISKRRNPGCLNLQVSILISYLISILSNFFLIIIIYGTTITAKWIGVAFSIVLILLCLLSFKYYLTYTSNTVIRFRSSTRFFILSFVVTGICYIVLFILLITDKSESFSDYSFFFGFAFIAWFVFHFLLFSLLNSFIKGLEGKSGVSLIDRDFKELGGN